MKIRNLYCSLAAGLALAVAGCSSDEPAGTTPDKGGNDSKDAMYMSVTVQLPVGDRSRSETTGPGSSTGGTEDGLPNENKVTSILLVLAGSDNSYIGCAERVESLSTETGGKVTTVQSISKTVLSTYYGGETGVLDDTKQQVNVFVFCNPTGALRDIFAPGALTVGDKTWYDKACTINETSTGAIDNAAIWGGPDHQGGFLMSSYELATKQFPKKFSDWENFTTVDKPFMLTGQNTGGSDTDSNINNGSAIKVERSVARFDFKDGSGNNNTYDVIKNGDNVIMQIKLTKMALVNMSKNFYYLRRVSTDGKKTDASLCGAETATNYVVDTDADIKADGTLISGKKFNEYFNFGLGYIDNDNSWTISSKARDQWYTSKISDVLGGTADNPSWTGKPGDYRIWRYVTENTIPSEESNQKNGISTGVVFKGKMEATESTTGTLANALRNATGIAADDPILYVYQGIIYVRWTEVRAAAIEAGTGDPLYKAVFGNTTVTPVAAKNADGDTPAVTAVYSTDENSADFKWDAWYNNGKDAAKLKEFKSAATTAKFTLYESSKDEGVAGYYCYYFYWNRHNDNGKPGVMGTMEFGVVRNNVYKLAVTNIRRLGHPRVSENDPDPVKPENPDESGDVYLSVSCEVMPWTVRVNDIDF